MVSACPPAPLLPSDAWPPPPCSGVLAARRRLHDRARLKLSRTGSRSTTSGDHPRGPRRAGDKLILFIHRPTPCTPRGQCQRGHFRRLLQTGIAGSGLLWASQLDPQPAWPGPGRGGHCGGRAGGSRDMKTVISERSCMSCSYHKLQLMSWVVTISPLRGRLKIGRSNVSISPLHLFICVIFISDLI